jgi:hypothetical protein
LRMSESKGPLAAAANALDLAIKLGVLTLLGLSGGGIILPRRYLIQPGLAVADRRGQWSVLPL